MFLVVINVDHIDIDQKHNYVIEMENKSNHLIPPSECIPSISSQHLEVVYLEYLKLRISSLLGGLSKHLHYRNSWVLNRFFTVWTNCDILSKRRQHIERIAYFIHFVAFGCFLSRWLLEFEDFSIMPSKVKNGKVIRLNHVCIVSMGRWPFVIIDGMAKDVAAQNSIDFQTLI